VAREGRYERGAHRSFGEQIADEIGNAERDREGVHVVARAIEREDHLIADEAEDAAGQRRETGDACRAREAWLRAQAPASFFFTRSLTRRPSTV
jgi:hypothetical protein